MRLQLALNVADLDAAVAYYSKLFGVAPHKRRDGYANFAVETPPLKLVLFENPRAEQRLHHLGVEVFTGEELDDSLQRLTVGGILDDIQHQETCCHATQEKIWSREPDGLRWEWYRTLDDAPETNKQAPARDSLGRTCCVGADGNAESRAQTWG